MHIPFRRLAFGMLILGVAQVLMACSVLGSMNHSSSANDPNLHDPTSDVEIRSIADDYPNWQALTDQPRRVADYIYLLWRLPSDEEYLAAESLHGPFFVKVYVNDIGADAIFDESDPIYPVGTVIVKEKSSGVAAEFADHLGIMIKREAGFNPDGDDWEYIYWEGGDIFQAPTADLSHCQDCHVSEAEDDSVFRLGSPQAAQSYDSIEDAPPSESE
jgi:hypothetical protein